MENNHNHMHQSKDNDAETSSYNVNINTNHSEAASSIVKVEQSKLNHQAYLTPKYPHPFLAKEGWYFIIAVIVLCLMSTIYFSWPFKLLSIIIAGFVIQFFRDPARKLPENIDRFSVVAPADGRVVYVGESVNPYIQEKQLKISIFMNIFNVHSNRAPMDGKIEAIHYFEGSFLNAALDKASLENERNAIILHGYNQHKITFVQIAGLVARRIVCYSKVQESLYAGQRYGFIRFGSRVDVYLPLGSELKVQLGQKVSATSSLLAQLPPI
jgi:phosphatidylserine decarboxylase